MLCVPFPRQSLYSYSIPPWIYVVSLFPERFPAWVIISPKRRHCRWYQPHLWNRFTKRRTWFCSDRIRPPKRIGNRKKNAKSANEVTYDNCGYGNGSVASSGVAPTPASRWPVRKFFFAQKRLNDPATVNTVTHSTSTSSPSKHSAVRPVIPLAWKVKQQHRLRSVTSLPQSNHWNGSSSKKKGPPVFCFLFFSSATCNEELYFIFKLGGRSNPRECCDSRRHYATTEEKIPRYAEKRRRVKVRRTSTK